MIYLRARFYAPELNRFSQKDLLRGSIFDGGSLNRYLYCQNDPVDFADYNGRQMCAVSCLSDGGGSGGTKKVEDGKNAVRSLPSVKSSANACSNIASSVRNQSTAIVQFDDGGGGSNTPTVAQSRQSTGAMSEYGRIPQKTITPEEPSVESVTGEPGYSCARKSESNGANVEAMMKLFGVDSPEELPELPENAMVVIENVRSLGYVVEGRAIVMDSEKYCMYTFFGGGIGASGLIMSSKLVPGADMTITASYVYGVSDPSDYAGWFFASSAVFPGVSDGGAIVERQGDGSFVSTLLERQGDGAFVLI